MEPWRRRYEELRGLFRVTRHFATTEEFLNDQVLYDFAGVFMQGLALTRAAQVGVEADRPGRARSDARIQDRAVWPPSSPTGGARARAAPHRPRRPARRHPPDAPRHRRRSSRGRRATARRTVRAMLFADVAGFSGLPEPHLPAFFIEFLALVEQELKTTPTLFQNTWGDGLYIVFADVATCAGFALRLLQRLERFDFASFGFKLKEDKKPGVRIGLHTGPVFEGSRRDHRPQQLFRQPRQPGGADRAGDGAGLRFRQRAVRRGPGHDAGPRLRVRVPRYAAVGQGL